MSFSIEALKEKQALKYTGENFIDSTTSVQVSAGRRGAIRA